MAKRPRIKIPPRQTPEIDRQTPDTSFPARVPPPVTRLPPTPPPAPVPEQSPEVDPNAETKA